MTRNLLAKVLGVVLAVAVVVTAVLLVLPGGGKKHLTAEFPRTVSLYSGSDVKILGVKVGTIDSVKPAGDKVVVKMSYDDKYQVPVNADAVLVSPSIVGDRFVQLTPAYKSGKEMPDNAVLSTKRTSVPLELDQIYGSLNDVSIALGPDGVNQTTGKGVGALTRLLDSTARNFGGQGVQFNKTITNIARLTKVLGDNKDNIFGTVREVERFVNTLAENDTTVRAFNDSLASAADLLAGERQDLAAALRNLATALTSVKGFVSDNKALLGKNIKDINTIAKIVVKRRDSLDQILAKAPGALNNLALAYNPRIGVLNTRANITESGNQLTSNPASVICGFVAAGSQAGQACVDALGGLLGNNRAAALPRSSTPDDRYQYVDPTLGGLVEGAR